MANTATQCKIVQGSNRAERSPRPVLSIVPKKPDLAALIYGAQPGDDVPVDDLLRRLQGMTIQLSHSTT